LTDLDGKTYDSKKLMDNGKKTLFVMAAEWCPHCKNEMPSIQQFYDENKEKVLELSLKGNEINKASDVVKDPYVFEFLGLPEEKPSREGDLPPPSESSEQEG